MTSNVAVDAERLVVNWLATRTAVTSIVGQHIVTVMPKAQKDPTSAQWPMLRVSLIDEVPKTQPLHLTSSMIQLDCYGGSKATARSLLDAARKEIGDNLTGAHTEGIVTGVTFQNASYLPDETYDPAQPRFQATVFVHAHPSKDQVS